MWKALVVILLVAAIAGGGYWFYSSRLNQAFGETVQVSRGSITASVSATGKVEPREEVKLSFKIGGRLKAVPVVEGQLLEPGRLVAELDPGTLKLAVDEAETSLALRRLRLQQARRGTRQEEINAARAGLGGAQARLDNLRGRPRPDEVAEARASRDAAQARLDNLLARPRGDEVAGARATLDKAKVALENAQTAYDRVSWAPNITELSQARQLHLATIELEAAQANYDRTIRGAVPEEIRAAEADVNAAQASYDRVVRGATPEEIRAAEAEVDAARAKLELAENGPLSEDIAVLEKEVELARLTLERARINLDDIRLIAPNAGNVLTAPARVGEYVAPQQVVATIGGLGDLRLRADIDEVDVGKVGVGQEVSISFDAFPGEKAAGRIMEILPDAKVKAGATVYEAMVEFSTKLPVRPRMAADLTITASRKDGILLLPNRAIQTVGRKKVVEMLDGDRIARRTVDVGLSDETRSEILEGLAEGEVVLIR